MPCSCCKTSGCSCCGTRDCLCCRTPDKVKKLLQNEGVSDELSTFFKAFSEPIRVKILLAMLHEEICVKDLVAVLNVSQPRISNQLKLLKLDNLVKTRKEKNSIFYSLNDKYIQDILSIGLEHMSHQGGNE